MASSQRNRSEAMTASQLCMITQKSLKVVQKPSQYARQAVSDATFTFVYKEIKSEEMMRAERYLKESNMGKVKWCHETAIIGILTNLKKDKKEPQGCFVVPNNNEDLANQLHSFGCRVYGVLAILQLNFEEQMPRSDRPLMSLFFHKKHVVITSPLTISSKEKLETYIRKMGGTVTKAFTTSTNLLISEQITSAKALAARKQRVRIVLPDLVIRCWKYTQKCQERNIRDVYAENTIPIFCKLAIAVTHIDFDQRAKLEENAEKYGYVYMKNLDRTKTTHLLCDEAEGEKFKAALRWRLPILRYAWYEDSIAAGIALDEEKYRLPIPEEYRKIAEEAATGAAVLKRKHDGADSPRNSMDKQPKNSDEQPTKAKSPRMSKSPAKTKSPRMSKSPRKSASKAKRSKKGLFDESLDANTTEDKAFGVYQHLAEKYLHFTSHSTTLFENLSICPIGFHQNDIDFLKQLIENNAGEFMHCATSGPSHLIILDDCSETERSRVFPLKHMNSKPCKIMSIRWILDSLNALCLLSEKDYEIVEKTMVEPVPTQSSADSAAEEPRRVERSQNTSGRRISQSRHSQGSYEYISLIQEYSQHEADGVSAQPSLPSLDSALNTLGIDNYQSQRSFRISEALITDSVTLAATDLNDSSTSVSTTASTAKPEDVTPLRRSLRTKENSAHRSRLEGCVISWGDRQDQSNNNNTTTNNRSSNKTTPTVQKKNVRGSNDVLATKNKRF